MVPVLLLVPRAEAVKDLKLKLNYLHYRLNSNYETTLSRKLGIFYKE